MGRPARTRSIETWSGEREVLPGVTLSQPGGHFPGSAVAHWAAGADGKGVLLSGDTVFANPDRALRRVHAQLPEPPPAVRRR